MRDFFRYVQLSARILVREDLWFFLIPTILLLFTGAWTLTVHERNHWSSGLAIGQAEVLGPLLAAFLCAGLLDPEKRRGAGEIIFCKPFPPALLLGVRLSLMLLANMGLLFALLLVYQLYFGDAAILKALLYALPNCLFIALVALTAAQFGRNTVAGYVIPLLFWLWDSTAGALYNPLFTLPTASMAASLPQDSMLAATLPWSKATLILTALLLFGINVRWLVTGRAEGGSDRGPLLLRRLQTPVTALLLLLAYFVSGALVNIALLQQANTNPGENVFGPGSRPIKGTTLASVNRAYREKLGIYGPIPLPSLLGDGTAHFLLGLGVGLDSLEAGYMADCRSALELAVYVDRFSLCRDNARLELAALDASPAPFENRWNAPVTATPPAEEENRVTVGLVDSDRWWVTRQPTGPNPVRAEDLCREILEGDPSPVLATQALKLRASLAEQRWDFRAAAADLSEIVEGYPSTALAADTVPTVAHTLVKNGQRAEAIALYRRVMRRQPSWQREALALALAALLAQNGDSAEARRTLQKALTEVKKDEDSGSSSQSMGNDMSRALEGALKDLEKADARPSRRFQAESGPRLSAHSRILADGKPLPEITVALVPLATAGQALPFAAVQGWDSPRPPGRFPAETGHRVQSYGGNETWNTEQLTYQLREHPDLVARSDSQGRVSWQGLPPGAYAVFLRLGTWQLPEKGRHLTPIPLESPILLAGPETEFPDLLLVTPIRLTPAQSATGQPSLRWDAMPGAARYDVALRIDNASQRQPMMATDAGNGASMIDPDVVWWRAGIREPLAELTPEHFVGPANDTRSNGLRGGIPYNWCVVARDASGKILRTSETLAAPVTVTGQDWTALKPPVATAKEHGGSKPNGLMIGQSAASRPYQPVEYSSPFLQSLRVDTDSLPPSPPSRHLPVSALPVAAAGQGLPPRIALLSPMASTIPGAPRALAGMPGMPSPMAMPMPGQSAFPPAPGATSPPLRNLPPAGALMTGAPGHPMPMPGLAPGAAPSGPLFILPPKGMPLQPLPGQPLPPGKASPPPLSAPNRSIVLETFAPASLTAWNADKTALEDTPAQREGGLLYAEAVTLTHHDAPLLLPQHTRRAILEIANGKAEADLLLKDASGKERHLSFKPHAPNSARLEASLPDGTWSLVSLHLSPKAGARVRLIALSIEVPPAPGLFALTHSQGDSVLLELYNLGPALESIVLTTGSTPADTTYAEFDLAAQGKAVIRLPAAALANSLQVRWSKGAMPIPK